MSPKMLCESEQKKKDDDITLKDPYEDGLREDILLAVLY